MDEIPDDIKAVSLALIDTLNDQAVVFFSTEDGDAIAHQLGLSIIARALLAEREAATKAEREYIADFVEAKMSDVDPEYGTFIATAIRSGARP